MSLVWASLPFSSKKGLNALKIDKKLIRHIAALAKLEIDENDIDKWIGQMNEIIAFADRLNEFNLQDFSETAHGFDAPGVFLEDVSRHIREGNAGERSGCGRRMLFGAHNCRVR